MSTPTRCQSCGLVFFAEDHPDACPRCNATRLAPSRPPSAPPPPAAPPPRSGLGATIAVALGLLIVSGAAFYVVRHTSLFASSPFAPLGLSAEEEARFEAAVAPTIERLERHPRARSVLRNGTAGLELGALGFRRLSDEDLVRWNRLRIRLAEASPVVCAGMWNGGATDRDVATALLRLSDADLRGWFELNERAVVAELDAASPAPDYRHVLARGLRRIASRLPSARRQAFFASFGRQLSSDEACETTLIMLRGVDHLEPDIRIRFLRSLAGLLHDASAGGREAER